MINDCINGDIDMIITKSISRFARNTLDTLKYVRMLKEKSIAVFFEDENKVEKEIADISRRKEKLLDLRLENTIEPDIYEKKNQELAEQLKSCKVSRCSCMNPVKIRKQLKSD